MLLDRRSDRSRERRWHVAGTPIIGSLVFDAKTLLGGAFWPTIALLCVAAFFILGCAPFECTPFRAIPPIHPSAEAAATGIAVIGSADILGGPAFMTAPSVAGGPTTPFAPPAGAPRVGEAVRGAAHRARIEARRPGEASVRSRRSHDRGRSRHETCRADEHLEHPRGGPA